MRTELPRFGLEDRAGDILEALRSAGLEWAAIVTSSGILLGRVRVDSIKEPDGTAADIMEEGPSTYRPNVPLEELLGRMHEHRFDMAFVTDPDGRLQGLITKRAIAHAMATHRRAS